MAVYRPLAQNTYKFVRETVLHNNGNISSPCEGNFCRVKMVQNNTVCYTVLVPVGVTSSATDFTVKKSSASAKQSSKWSMEAVPGYCMLTMQTGSCVVDGVTYYGHYNAQYGYAYFVSSASTISAKIFPKGNIKVVIYKAATGTIEVEDYSFITHTAPASPTPSGSGNYAYTYQYWNIIIPKTTNDIILAISIEYPKFDITIKAKDGVQYSADDGATFQELLQDVDLSQVEHVILKNTGTDAVNIGTTEGGAEVGTIAAGGTLVAIPATDGTWYIS